MTIKRVSRPERIRGDRLSPQDRSVVTVSDLIRALKAKPSQDVVWSAGHPTKDGARVKASNAARGRHSAWRGVDVAQFVFYHQEAADGTWSVVVGLARPEAPKPAAKRRRGR